MPALTLLEQRRAALYCFAANVQAPTELIMNVYCNCVWKLQHLLRTVGPDLPVEICMKFNDMQEAALQRILGGDLSETAVDRAMIRVAIAA